MATVRRPKWHPPPPQTPRILHLPRPPRRRKGSSGQGSLRREAPKGKLETLFGQERTFCYTIPPVVLLNSKEARDDEFEVNEEGKWRFQAEILRAECKFLRMEREIAAKRVDRERLFIERALKSALHSLISAKRKIGEGGNVEGVLEEEIDGLTKKVAEIQRTTRRDPELLKEERDKGKMNVQEIVKANLLRIGTGQGSAEACNKLTDVEILRRKMEGLSKGKLLKKMEEEYGLISSSLQEPLHLQVGEQNICAGHCKAIVRRIMEQVRAETEQWSKMQEMLGQVREEMEELQSSRDFWEDRALDCDCKIKYLNKTVQEWKQKASSLEIKEKQQEELVRLLQEELQRKRKEKENKVLTCRVKGNNRRADDNNCIKTRETHHDGRKEIQKGGSRLPFVDIGNLSPLVRQASRRSVFPLRSPQH